jgi:hypothetical protein
MYQMKSNDPDPAATAASETAAAVLLLSIEPLIALARHAKFHRIEETLQELVAHCEAHGALRHKTAMASEERCLETFEHGVAERHLLAHSASTYRALCRRSAIVRSDFEQSCGQAETIGLKQTLQMLDDAKCLVAWLAVTLPAQSGECFRAKAEILLDWVGEDKDSIPDQLSSVMCREILAHGLPQTTS